MYTIYIYMYMYFYIPAYLFCTLHTRSHLIRDSTVLIRFYIPHRFTFVLFYTRYIFTSSRILYLVSSVERSHTVLYSYFDILHPPYSRGINIFPRIVYVSCFTHFRGCDFYYFFFTLFPFPFFINLRSFFHPYDPISHIQRPSSRSVKYHSDEFVGIFSDRKYHNYRGIIKNRLDQRQR